MAATLTFDDEFNTLSLWNGSSGAWSTTTGFSDPAGNGSSYPANGEQEWYINANYGPTSSVHPWTVSDGVLTLTAQRADPSIVPYLGSNQAGFPGMGAYQWTSGLIGTDHSFSQTYGYFEMRAQLPAGQGMWPAFWLLKEDGSYPPEIDVMEAVGKDPSTVYTTVHTAETGVPTAEGLGENVGNFATSYHDYAVDWEPDTITFYIDEKQVYQVATPADMHSPMYMIANLAVGGSWAGAPDASTPAINQMNIDWIRAWDSNPYTNGGAIPGGSSQTSVPLPASGTPVAASGAQTAPDFGGWLAGGDASDTLTGGANGENTLQGGAGDDSLLGGGVFDSLMGMQGNDSLDGGWGGNDWLVGGQGNDLLVTHTGDGLLYGNLGNDTLQGADGHDVMRGGQGDDSLSGGAGDDWLSGDRGHDTVAGGAGADVFHSFADAGVTMVTDFHPEEGDRVQVDPGDTYAVSQQGGDVVVDMSAGGEVVLQNTQLSSLHDGWIFAA
ncbi:family 16 glycosylhydrolase [Phenylobacterium sp.]|uniref:family 16 glycosylhydrolase n=1 Tax=Phenylobacterium sp. TaxID=1871053 RepID=UPI00261E4FF9|nr:family 16 glycosylhydrolase [Phenylobacterium sp.]